MDVLWTLGWLFYRFFMAMVWVAAHLIVPVWTLVFLSTVGLISVIVGLALIFRRMRRRKIGAERSN